MEKRDPRVDPRPYDVVLLDYKVEIKVAPVTIGGDSVNDFVTYSYENNNIRGFGTMTLASWMVEMKNAEVLHVAE